jgi:hypothetical protein
VIADVIVVVVAIAVNVVLLAESLAVAGLALLYALYRVVRLLLTGSAYPKVTRFGVGVWALGSTLDDTIERLLSLQIDPGFREVCVEASSARMPTGSCGERRSKAPANRSRRCCIRPTNTPHGP